MKRIDALISLVNTLGRTERRAFAMRYMSGKELSGYGLIFNLIAREGLIDSQHIRSRYAEKFSDSAFDSQVKYLFSLITDMLVDFRCASDETFSLMKKISIAVLLFDRSLYDEALELLAEVIDRGRALEQHELVMLAQKMELEFQLSLDFPRISEGELFARHNLQRKLIKRIDSISSHASLYHLLRHRMNNIGSIKSPAQQKMLSDLVVSEHYAFSTDTNKAFELERNHKMFQASYLLETGDMQGAIGIYADLHNQFMANPHLQTSSVMTGHLNVVEGIFKVLRYHRRYDEIGNFIKSLEPLTHNLTQSAKSDIMHIIAVYSVVPYIDTGYFDVAEQIYNKYQSAQVHLDSPPTPLRQAELLFCEAIIHIGLGRLKPANRTLQKIMSFTAFSRLPIGRAAQLLRLATLFDLGDSDLMAYEARKISRRLGNGSQGVEKFMLRFLNTGIPVMRKQRLALLKKMDNPMQLLKNDRYERQMLTLFDFTAWVKAKLTGESLGEILKNNSLT